MADIVPFPGARKRKARKSRQKTLCNSGFHKWAIDDAQQFDVIKGRLVTVERCSRCGLVRTSLK